MILKIDHLHIVRYSARHASASADVLNRRRTLEEVRLRLRHRSETSTKRYRKAARIQKFAHKFPPAVLEYGSQVRTQLRELYQGRIRMPPPSIP